MQFLLLICVGPLASIIFLNIEIFLAGYKEFKTMFYKDIIFS